MSEVHALLMRSATGSEVYLMERAHPAAHFGTLLSLPRIEQIEAGEDREIVLRFTGRGDVHPESVTLHGRFRATSRRREASPSTSPHSERSLRAARKLFLRPSARSSATILHGTRLGDRARLLHLPDAVAHALPRDPYKFVPHRRG